MHDYNHDVSASIIDNVRTIVASSLTSDVAEGFKITFSIDYRFIDCISYPPP